MRIALISTCALSTPPKKYGGTELVVAELAKGLIGLGHDVTVFATGDSGVFGELKHHFERPVWPPNELAESRHAGFAWRDIAQDAHGYDVVHVHHAAALPFQPLSALPTVLTVHHMRVDSLLTHYQSYPDVALVAISNRQAELSPELRFARTIHHGLDPSLYAAGGGGDYVAFLGRFASEKAPHLAIDAARAASVRLLLGGEPHAVPEAQSYFERELKPRLASAGGDLEWCGELSHGPKVRLLAGARALLFPLDWEEPFGLVMIEAMLVGTPVIAFARGSAPEVVEDGVTGFLVHSAEQMAERIRQLDRIDRTRCRARAVERWSGDRMARDYAGLYAQLRERTGRVAHGARVVPLTPTQDRTRAAAGTEHGAKHR